MAIELEPEAALENQREPNADWAVARRRMRAGTVVPAHQPTFLLKPTDTVFTMGSCFARNIEKLLAKLGCRVPVNDYALPESERTTVTPNDALTLFTPPTFAQIIEWVDCIHSRDGKVTAQDCEQWLFHYPDGTAWDMGLAGVRPIALARIVSRRQEIFDLYKNAFTAECVMMTPGLIEAWFDRKNGLYTIYAPLKDRKVIEAGRFAFRALGYEDCLQPLLRTIDVIRKHNPNVKILMTVSPVPLRYTFTNKDVLTANSYSKAVLRTACEQIAASRDAVDYFPSFEAVNYSTRGVWQLDRRHVSEAMIKKIVQTAIAQYFGGHAPENYEKFQYPFLERLWRTAFGT